MKITKRIGILMFCSIAMLLVAPFIISAAETLVMKRIEVYTGVDIYVDDVLLDSRDANGNSVEAFVYNGTTYLPMRTIGEALGTVVEWEGSSLSAYIGKRSDVDRPQVWLKDLDYFMASGSFGTLEKDYDNLGNTHTNVVCNNFDRTYKINAKYSKFTGTFYQRYERRSNSYLSSFKVYADDELVYEAEMNRGIEPIYFDIPLDGVLELRIVFYGPDAAWLGYYNASLGEAGFYLAE